MTDHLNAVPAALTTASGDLARIGARLAEGNASALLPTTAIAPAAADQVSAAVTDLFGAQGAWWQDLAAQGQAFQQQFVLALQTAADAYLQAEAHIAAWLTSLPGVGSLFVSGAVGPTVPGLPSDGHVAPPPSPPPPPPVLGG